MRDPRPHDMIDVHLVGPSDTDGAAADDADAASAAEYSQRERSRGRIVRWVGLGVLAAVLAATVGVNVVADRREAARREAFADVPWVLPRMGGPLEEVWRATGGGLLLTHQEGIAVIADRESRGDLRGLDTATGEQLWARSTVRGADCFVLHESLGRPAILAALTPDLDEVACISQDATMDAEGNRVVVSPTELEILDVRTGAELVSLDLDDGAVVAVEAIGDDLVVVCAASDASLLAQRVERRTGTIRWTYRSAAGALSGDTSEWSITGSRLQVGDAAPLALSVETGAELPVVVDADDADAGPAFRALLPDGATAEWRGGGNGRVTDGRVLESDGSTRFALPGTPWRTSQTDGSAPDVFVVQSPDAEGGPDADFGLVGLDAATGERLWTRVDGPSWPVLQLEGVVVANGAGARAIDLRSGEELWEVTDVLVFATTVTDGDVVLALSQHPGRRAVVALDLRAGTEVWRMPAPADLIGAENVDGTVLVLGEDEIVAYR